MTNTSSRNSQNFLSGTNFHWNNVASLITMVNQAGYHVTYFILPESKNVCLTSAVHVRIMFGKLVYKLLSFCFSFRSVFTVAVLLFKFRLHAVLRCPQLEVYCVFKSIELNYPLWFVSKEYNVERVCMFRRCLARLLFVKKTLVNDKILFLTDDVCLHRLNMFRVLDKLKWNSIITGGSRLSLRWAGPICGRIHDVHYLMIKYYFNGLIFLRITDD